MTTPAGRDWLAMRPEDFDATIALPEPSLFDLPVDDVTAAPAPDDGYGTGDLFAEIDSQ